MDNGTLDFSLFYSDGLHLVKKGNLGKSVLKAIDSIIIVFTFANNVICQEQDMKLVLIK